MEGRERTRVVVDDTTVYEIDLDCQECQNVGNGAVRELRNVQGNEKRAPSGARPKRRCQD